MKKNLSNREIDVMNVLWQSEKPLTASGITQCNPALSINTVQVVLKNLLKKSYVKVADIVYSGTVLSRAYEPKITQGEYITNQLLEEKGGRSNIFAALIEQETDPKVIEDLEELLRCRKEQLKGVD